MSTHTSIVATLTPNPNQPKAGMWARRRGCPAARSEGLRQDGTAPRPATCPSLCVRKHKNICMVSRLALSRTCTWMEQSSQGLRPPTTGLTSKTAFHDHMLHPPDHAPFNSTQHSRHTTPHTTLRTPHSAHHTTRPPSLETGAVATRAGASEQLPPDIFGNILGALGPADSVRGPDVVMVRARVRDQGADH